jgi:DNA primase
VGYDNHELMAVVEMASKYYGTELLKGTGVDRDRARGYVSERRLFAPMVEQFRVGFAPIQKGKRPWILMRMPDKELLTAAGIINVTEDGRVYDPMDGRVVFPQVNPSGKYTGFVGRYIGTERKDKYLATGVTSIFRRAETLYRIDKARVNIERTPKRVVIVVEGLLDAALMFQVGVTNVVATGTKSMTDAQAQILSRYAKNVEVMFDNDEQGRNGYEVMKRQRARYFESMGWRQYPAKFNDPADWVSSQIDHAIQRQQAAV